jgi:Undecaprenyl-phosphate glucose phosphotransferase
MKLRNRQLLILWFLVWDLLVTAGAWVGAFVIRFWTGWIPVWKEPGEFNRHVAVLPLVLLLAFLSYSLIGLYQVHRLRRLREELIGILKGVSLLLLLVLATLFYRQDHFESRLAILLFYGLTMAGILVVRRISWGSLRFLRQSGFNRSPVLIVGTGRVARKTANALQQAGWTGLYVLGFVEDEPQRRTLDLDILGTTGELPRLIAEHKVGHVFIALPLNRYHEARRVFDILSQTVVDVRLVADAPDLAGLSLTTTTIEGLTVIGLRESPHFGLNVLVKRTMDIVLSFTALVLLSPVLLLVSLLVKFSSRGPIFYRQERCGLGGEPFSMLKFRTMSVDAEAQSGPVWAKEDDPRRTRLGTFLRKTSLDELPQLINVLKGDMSLVGPRPERPVFIEQFKHTVPNYMARHCVKAGITGWAQVNGWRGNTSLRKRVQFDLYYISHWNPWFDLRILWMTMFRVFEDKNAY